VIQVTDHAYVGRSHQLVFRLWNDWYEGLMNRTPESKPADFSYPSALVGMIVGVLVLVDYLSILVVFIGGTALIGYVYSEQPFLIMGSYGSMPLHSSIVFVFLALG
jgi:hypothetical protein